jgi:hypothetical protein
MLLRVYLVIMAIGTFIGATEQIFLAPWVARLSTWGFSAGWQREIGFWNLGAIVLVERALVSDAEEPKRLAAVVLVTLNALFGTNHLLALVAGPRAPIHVWGTVLNYAAGAIGVVALARTGAAGAGFTRR